MDTGFGIAMLDHQRKMDAGKNDRDKYVEYQRTNQSIQETARVQALADLTKENTRMILESLTGKKVEPPTSAQQLPTSVQSPPTLGQVPSAAARQTTASVRPAAVPSAAIPSTSRPAVIPSAAIPSAATPSALPEPNQPAQPRDAEAIRKTLDEILRNAGRLSEEEFWNTLEKKEYKFGLYSRKLLYVYFKQYSNLRIKEDSFSGVICYLPGMDEVQIRIITNKFKEQIEFQGLFWDKVTGDKKVTASKMRGMTTWKNEINKKITNEDYVKACWLVDKFNEVKKEFLVDEKFGNLKYLCTQIPGTSGKQYNSFTELEERAKTVKDEWTAADHKRFRNPLYL